MARSLSSPQWKFTISRTPDDLSTPRLYASTSTSSTLLVYVSTSPSGELDFVVDSAEPHTHHLHFYRRLCGKLYLKAETQQVDRILVEFSRRYWENNPSAIYGSAGESTSLIPSECGKLTCLRADVVHAASYSLLLLNTDLHVVDTDRRMTKNQFVRNTLSAISMQADDPEVDTTPALLFRSATHDGSEPVDNVFGGDASTSRKSLDQTMSRNSSVVSWSASTPGGSPRLTRDSPHHSHQQVNTLRSESSATVNSSGSQRSVDAAMESTLKVR